MFLLVSGSVDLHIGEYEHFSDSCYNCNLSKHGKISIFDVGAGNPVLKGHLFQLTKDKYLLFCPTDEDFDENFLNVKKVSVVNVGFSKNRFTVNGKIFTKKQTQSGNRISGRIAIL